MLVSTPCLRILPESDHQSGKLSSLGLSANAIVDLRVGYFNSAVIRVIHT